jgi:hypothetical protein
MFSPEAPGVDATGSSARAAVSGIYQWLLSRQTLHRMARGPRLAVPLRVSEFLRIAAPKQERSFSGGCLVMFWLISAASYSGYVILAFFVIISLARFAKHAALALAESLPRGSLSRHHIITWISAAFFSLLTVRACYIAAVIVDTRFR